MVTTSRSLSSLAIAFILLSAIARSLSAQDAAVPDSVTAVLGEGLRVAEQVKDLGERSRRASGPDREVLERMLDRKSAELEKLEEELEGKLLEGLDSQDAPDLDQATREAALELLEQTAHRLAATTETQLEGLSNLYAAIPDQADEELNEHTLEIEEREARAQSVLGLWSQAELRLETLGAGSPERRLNLTTTISDRAEILAGRLELWRKRLPLLAKTSAGDEEQLKRRQTAMTTLMASTHRELQSTIEIMGRLGLDTEAATASVVATSGEISEEILSAKVALGLGERLLARAREWIETSGRHALFRSLVFVAIVLLFIVLGRGVRRIVSRLLRPRAGSKLIHDTAVQWSYRAVVALGLLLALSQLGFHVTPLLAGLGIAGLVIGLALQDSLSNFVSGLMILGYSPFDIDDVVEVGGVSGKVAAMSLVATEILTFDNQLLMVPNRKVWGEVIRNVTARSERRVDLVFGVSYEDDIDKVKRVLHELVAADPRVLKDPEPNIRLHNLGDSSVDFIVRPWVRTEDYWDVYWDLTQAVKLRFDEEGISIPYPQRDLHLQVDPAKIMGKD